MSSLFTVILIQASLPTLNPDWGQQTQTTEVQIDGNNTLEYANLNYQGLEYPQTDVSAMEYVHLDYIPVTLPL